MTELRRAVVECAEAWFDSGGFERDLSAFVACPTTSQLPGYLHALQSYLGECIQPRLAALGFHCTVHDNPCAGGPPILVAERIEDTALTTVLGYGHGDVVHGQADQWREGLGPFKLVREDQVLYGRGTADNKGQHLINIAALEAVLTTRGALGFNARLIIEMGEEIGSPGLDHFVASHPELLNADVFIASDGPRLQPDTPTIFLGSRGCINFEMSVSLRDAAHHSGNWGGLLRDPAMVLCHAIASVSSVDGRLLIPEWRPNSLYDSVRSAISALPVELADGPEIDHDWGEPGLTAAEKVLGWNAFSVLSLHCGVPEAPQNAIAASATAMCQLRFVVGTSADSVVPALRRHLDAAGLGMVQLREVSGVRFEATRVDPSNPWVRFVSRSIEKTTGKVPHILPNLGGSLPNATFASLPTIWVPHSYRGCAQHAPNEHTLYGLSREALALMAGLYYDIGAGDAIAL